MQRHTPCIVDHFWVKDRGKRVLVFYLQTELLAHQGLFWFDSSIRFFTDIKAGIEKAVENRGIVLFSRTSHSTYSVTAPGH